MCVEKCKHVGVHDSMGLCRIDSDWVKWSFRGSGAREHGIPRGQGVSREPARVVQGIENAKLQEEGAGFAIIGEGIMIRPLDLNPVGISAIDGGVRPIEPTGHVNG